MIRTKKAALLTVIASLLAGCGGSCTSHRTEEIKALLNKELKVGDSKERVQEVLNGAEIKYSFDQFQNRYQSTVYDERCGQDDAVSITVSFDPSGKMLKVEVFESYTTL
jgi:hypothetical protein